MSMITNFSRKKTITLGDEWWMLSDSDDSSYSDFFSSSDQHATYSNITKSDSGFKPEEKIKQIPDKSSSAVPSLSLFLQDSDRDVIPSPNSASSCESGAEDEVQPDSPKFRTRSLSSLGARKLPLDKDRIYRFSSQSFYRMKKEIPLPGKEEPLSLDLKDIEELTKQTFHQLFSQSLKIGVIEYKKGTYKILHSEELKDSIKNNKNNSLFENAKKIHWFTLSSLQNPSFKFTSQSKPPSRKKTFFVF